MRKSIVAIGYIVLCSVLSAESTLSNDTVARLIKAGLSDELIVSIITASPGDYDTSRDGLISCKSAGASDKVLSAILLKAAFRSTTAQPSIPSSPMATEPIAPGKLTDSLITPANQQLAQSYSTSPQTLSKPRVFLQSASKGTNRNASRDQSMEMSKDFERDCPGVKVTVNGQMADYTVLLNHIEVGFVRDNQVQVANKEGDLLSRTKEGGSIAGGMRKACTQISADWAKK
jgi:hypothetical protein